MEVVLLGSFGRIVPTPTLSLIRGKWIGWIGVPLISLLIALMVILIVSTGVGIAAYLLTWPQPVIRVTSEYHIGSIPAGSTSTALHVSGHKFSSKSAIIFLLDGMPVPGNPSARSDADGNVEADLTVTQDWAVGRHTLTAKNASGYASAARVMVAIVLQGQAQTPGPNGAPPDDMSFTINMSIKHQDASTGQQYKILNEHLTIVGQPDPAGGAVCQSVANTQPQTSKGDFGSGITYTQTVVLKCSGTYKGGKLSYTETAISDTIVASSGVSCTAPPYTFEHLEGTFSDYNTINGIYSADAVTVSCTNGKSFTFYDPEKGAWTGKI